MIIGITGTNGAGKGTVVEYLVKQKGFTHYSARDFLFEEIDRRGMPRDRNSTNIVGNDLRARYGSDYVIAQLLGLALEKGGDAVIESVRTAGEVECLKSKGASLWAVDANPQLRYERVVLRGSGLDKVSFEEFCLQEHRELVSADTHKHNVAAVMRMADKTFFNDGTPEELFDQVEVALKGVDKPVRN